MNARLNIFFLRNFVFLIPLLFLVRCQQPDIIKDNEHVDQLLYEADSLKFLDFRKADLVLERASQILRTDSIAQYWARYQYVKSFIEMKNCNYNEALLLATKAEKYYSLNEMHEHISRIMLIKGFINESVLLFDYAFESYQKAFEGLRGSSQYKNEALMAVLGMSRISASVKEDYNIYLSKADSLIKNSTDELDKGIYWSHLGSFSHDQNQKRDYIRKALHYYHERNLTNKEFISQTQLLNE